MNKMQTLAVAAAALALGAAATKAAYAGSNQNGPALTGAVVPAFETGKPVVTRIVLPTGGTTASPRQTAR